MKEFDVAGETVAVVLWWTSIVLEPGGSKRLFLDDLVPVFNKYLGQLAVDVGLLVSVGSNPGGRCRL